MNDAVLQRATPHTVSQPRPRTGPFSGLRRQETIAGYLFLLPNLIGFLIFSLIPIIATFGLTLTDWNLIGERDLRRAGQLPEAGRGQALLADRKKHRRLHPGRGPDRRLHRLLAGAAAEPQDARRGLLPHRLLPAARDADRGGGHRLGLDLPPGDGAGELRARPDRHRRAALAAKHHLGDAGDHHHEQLEGDRLRDADLPGRVAGHPPGFAGSGDRSMGRRRSSACGTSCCR